MDRPYEAPVGPLPHPGGQTENLGSATLDIIHKTQACLPMLSRGFVAFIGFSKRPTILERGGPGPVGVGPEPGPKPPVGVVVTRSSSKADLCVCEMSLPP